MERIGSKLQRIDQEQSPRETLFELARAYVDLVGWNPQEIFPRLKDFSFWQADYLGKEKEGKEWGMSTKDAFRCLVDTERTLTLFAGIRESVRSLKERGRRNIVAVDAGTGTGILAMFLAAQGCEHVYALEINQGTAKVAEKFIEVCGFSDRITLLVGDATAIDIPALRKNPAQILVSENLSSGLFDEPQFQIINHISQYLTRDTMIIPSTAENFVSLGWANWEGVDPEKNNIAARRLKELKMTSLKHRFATVDANRGMRVPAIRGRVRVPVVDLGKPINALVFSTRFQINKAGTPYFLEPDTAEFLGKSSAFRLPEGVGTKKGFVEIDLSYPAGFPRSQRKLDVHNNKISFRGSLQR